MADIDFHEESLALAQAVVQTSDQPVDLGRPGPAAPPGRRRDLGAIARRAPQQHDRRLFAEAGLEHDPELLRHYYEFWEPHTTTDPETRPLLEALRSRGIKVGVLSNTLWPRSWHRGFFERDGVLDLIDADVYTSEIAWTKPAPQAFGAILEALGLSDPARCVYVGDRLFDEVWGAHNAGLKAVHIPSATSPSAGGAHRGRTRRRRAPARRDRRRDRPVVT